MELDLAVLLFRMHVRAEVDHVLAHERDVHTVGEVEVRAYAGLCRTAPAFGEVVRVVVGLLHGVVEAMAGKDVRLHGLAGRSRIAQVKEHAPSDVLVLAMAVVADGAPEEVIEPIRVHAVRKADAQLPAGTGTGAVAVSTVEKADGAAATDGDHACPVVFLRR